MHECVRLLFEEGDSLGQRGDADCLMTCDCMSFEVPALLERCCLPMPCCLGAVTLGTDAVPVSISFFYGAIYMLSWCCPLDVSNLVSVLCVLRAALGVEAF
jgi:hypothetical protein